MSAPGRSTALRVLPSHASRRRALLDESLARPRRAVGQALTLDDAVAEALAEDANGD